MPRSRVLTCTVATALGVVATLAAQRVESQQEPLDAVPVAEQSVPSPPQAPASGEPEDVRFSGAADVVVLHVSVKDKRGRYVDGLPREAFAVFEDNASQPIGVFINDDEPVTVGLLIDSSISMFAIRDQMITAAVAFADASHPRDETFALAFNEDVRAALPANRPFTSDSAVLRDALVRVVTARGKTALLDAISAGLDYSARGAFERKVLIAISDGGDNASTTTSAEVIAKTQASNVVIYTVTLDDPFGNDRDAKLMKQLAEATGGAAFTPKDIREVRDTLQRIAVEIRHSYTVGYVLPRPQASGYRRIRLTVTPPSGDQVVVRTRTGYLVGVKKGSNDAK